MSRLIDIDDPRNCYIWTDGEYEKYNIDPDVIAEASSVQPERKVGQWLPLQLSMAHPPYQCSCCFRNAPMVESGCLVNRYLEALLTPYCPNCGAYMKGECEHNEQT